MIKVNLINEHTGRVRRVSVAPSISRMGLVFAAVLVLTVAGLGGYWYALNRQINSLTETRDRLKAEDLRLRGLKNKLIQYEKLKQVLQDRIDVIERLKEFQTGPVLLLNHMIASIPRDSQIWLTGFEQKGDRVHIAGYAAHSDVIPDLMVNLAANAVFKSVELELIQEDKDAAKFSLLCTMAQKKGAE